jgi:hypothetical protein
MYLQVNMSSYHMWFSKTTLLSFLLGQCPVHQVYLSVSIAGNVYCIHFYQLNGMGGKIYCFPDVTVIIVIVHTMSIWFNQYPVMCYLFRCHSKQKIENNDVLITFPIWMFPKLKYPYFVHERHFAIMNTWICISKIAGARFVFIIKGE